MYKYKIKISWSEEDQAYTAEVPELPGCMADGSTYNEAIDNVSPVIAEWIETEKWKKSTCPFRDSAQTKNKFLVGKSLNPSNKTKV